MAKPKILFLAHRIPYPPHKGEKLRAYHLIKGLAETYDVFLGAPVDDPDDWQHRNALDDLCVETCIADGRGRSRQRAAVEAVARREPVSFAYFRHKAMTEWVRKVTREHRFEAVILYSSGTAPYLAAIETQPERLIVDFVDVDSEKWRVLGETQGGVMGRVYAREAVLMRDAERKLAQRADASLFVTENEAALFERVTGVTERVHAIGNGVELDGWQDADALPSPYAADGNARVIFTGAMDYVPNVDAVTWFAKEAMPALRAAGRKVTFVIAGSNPTKAVQSLARDDVEVTGRVPDMKPYLIHADLAVAPLQLARGVQNKVLEAMAARLPAVVTAAALDGIGAIHDESVIVAGSGAEFATAIATLLDDPARATALAASARKLIEDDYSWAARIEALERVITSVDPTASRSAA